MPRVVLIVEDSRYSAATLELTVLSIPGVQVSHFSNGEDALRFLLSGPGDVGAVITDLHLPLMDGFELIHRIRSDCHLARLPILVVSGDTDPATPDRVSRLGADAFFAKPFSPTEIKGKLEQLLNASA